MIHIGGQEIGDNAPCYLTFEIGPTHDGVESAKRLIKHAAEAGADAVKFQIFDPDRLVADKKQLFSYDVLKNRKTGEIETIKEPLYEILKRRCLTNEQWRAVKSYCDEWDMAFFATVGFDEDVDLVEELGCHSIKIASADVNHFPLLKRVARTGMCIQLDTGMSTLEEIESAIEVIKGERNENIIIHQCPSGYPARLESIHLNMIKTLKNRFPYPVAYSDHSPGWEMDIAAVAMGANLVEKTITEDCTTRSVEHIMSLESDGMHRFIKTIRDVEKAFGKFQRILGPEEITNRNALRRSIFLKSGRPCGHQLTEDDFDYRRPGHGISPDSVDNILGKRLIKEKKANDMLLWSDIDEQ